MIEQLALRLDARDLTLDEAIIALAELPYRQQPYSRRGWGHSLHSVCSYPSRLKASIAYFLVHLFTRPGERIVDPFAGVGTIPLEASLQGRIGIGADINPIAALVSRAKVDPPNLDQAADVIDDLELALEKDEVLDSTESEIADFYHPETLRQILVARRFFARASHDSAHSLVLGCLLHLLHGNRPYALSRRSHNIIPIPPKGPTVYKPLIPRLTEKVKRVLSSPLPTEFARGRSIQMDFRELVQEGIDADHVISSPPFLGTTHFVRQNRLRLWMAGWDYETQETKRREFLEHSTDPDQYHDILRVSRLLVRKGGLVILHLGVVRKFDMAANLEGVSANYGLSVQGKVYETVSDLESHGRTDRGATTQHAFLVLRADT